MGCRKIPRDALKGLDARVTSAAIRTEAEAMLVVIEGEAIPVAVAIAEAEASEGVAAVDADINERL